MRYLVVLSLLASVLAQDTFYCPDGWHKYDGRAGCNCFWLAEYEMVTRDDATVLCSFHEAWVAELDGPGKWKLNNSVCPQYFIPSSQLLAERRASLHH